ncbi:MAG: putative secreted protein [Deltaproteobacteria bacterium]|nr:putative secreted protein [Deltaproteobacteria bacterium]
MRLSSIALTMSLVVVTACSKNAEPQPNPGTQGSGPGEPSGSAGSAAPPGATTATPTATTAPTATPVVKKVIDKTPLPALKADTGTATGKALWAASFGGLGIDTPKDLAISATGEVYVVGYFDGELIAGATTLKATDPEPSKDPKKKTVVTSDGFLVKLGNDGKIAWAKRFGAKRDDVALGVAVHGDTVVVVGNFLDDLTIGPINNNETDTHSSGGSDDVFVAAWNSKGDPQWLWTAGGIDSDGANAIAAAPDGGWYVGGSFSRLATFGKTELKSRGGTDAMLIKLAADGDLEWVKQFGGAYNDTILHLAADARGNVYVQGHFRDKSEWGSGTPLVAGGGSDNDVVLAKYDANGDHLWSKRCGNAFNDVAGGLTVDPAGNVTMVGSFDKSVSFADGDDHTSNGEADIFIARYDSAGKLDWAHTYGGDREDVGWGIASDAAGNTIMTGWFQNTVDFGKTTTTPIKSHGNKDVFAIKHDVKGNVVWIKTWGDKDHDQGRGVAIDDKGIATIAGLYRFTLTPDDRVKPVESIRAPDDRIPKPDTFVLRIDR